MIKIKPHTILHAMRHENIEKLDSFCQKGLDLENFKFASLYSFDISFVEQALVENKAKVLNYIVDKKFNLNPCDKDGIPLIIKLIQKKYTHQINTLIEMGIDFKSNCQIRLIDTKPSYTPLVYAVLSNYQEGVRLFVKNGAYIEKKDFDLLLERIKHNLINPHVLDSLLTLTPESDFTFLIATQNNTQKLDCLLNKTHEFLEQIALKQKLENQIVNCEKLPHKKLKI